MALETATWISELTPANPAAGDPVSQGDDHLRLLKQVLQNCFPGLNQSIFGVLAGYSPTSHTHPYLPLTGGTLSGLLNIMRPSGEQVQMNLGWTGSAQTLFIKFPSGEYGLYNFNNALASPIWLIRGVVDANGVTTGAVIGTNATVQGVLRADTYAISPRIIGEANEQNVNANAAVISQGYTGNIHLALHAIGNSSVTFMHTRGTTELSLLNNDGSAYATFHASNIFGDGQSVQDVTGSRAAGNTYTNGTSKPITVIITANIPNGVSLDFYVNGALTAYPGNNTTVYSNYTVSYVILPGHSYGIAANGSAVTRWVETR